MQHKDMKGTGQIFFMFTGQAVLRMQRWGLNMKTQYEVVSEYDRLDELQRPEDRRIEIDRRTFDQEESAIAFAKSLPCDIYAEPLDDSDGNAVYAILHTVYRLDQDYDGFPVDTVQVGCRRLPDECLPGAVKAYRNGKEPGKKYKGRWFPAQSQHPGPQSGRGVQTENVELSVHVPIDIFHKLASAAAAGGKSPEGLIQAILLRELNNHDQEERPDNSVPQPESGLRENGMGQDWEE
jgi:hypothetical protein